MAIKTFTSGEVLTASDTNTFLANSGLVYVAGGTFAAATIVDVTGFSSAYKTYRLVYQARRTDGAGNIGASAQFRSSTTPQASGYYYGSSYSNYLGATGSLAAGNNVTSMGFWGGADSASPPNLQTYDISLLQAQGVTWTGGGWYSGASYSWFYGGAVSTSLTIDRLRVSYGSPGSVTGYWQLYGYREP